MTRIFAVCLMLGLPLAAAPVFAAGGKDAAKTAVSPVAEAMNKILPDKKAKAAVEPAAPADNQNSGTQLPVPRFVTLGPDEVNLRTGPGTRYPIRYVIRRGGLPVEIVKEYEVWRQVKDVDGGTGWVHKSMLSGRRAVIVKGQVQPLLREPSESARPVARLEPGVIADLRACKGDWCSVRAATYEGWMKRQDLWGVYPGEQIKE